MRLFLLAIFFLFNLLFALPIFADQHLALFATAKAAQTHCPKDNVVWLNTASGIWHNSGSHWYGNTEHGAYVCEKEASTEGDRASRNG